LPYAARTRATRTVPPPMEKPSIAGPQVVSEVTIITESWASRTSDGEHGEVLRLEEQVDNRGREQGCNVERGK
jgi:hypothetical protein